MQYDIVMGCTVNMHTEKVSKSWSKSLMWCQQCFYICGTHLILQWLHVCVCVCVGVQSCVWLHSSLTLTSTPPLLPHWPFDLLTRLFNLTYDRFTSDMVNSFRWANNVKCFSKLHLQLQNNHTHQKITNFCLHHSANLMLFQTYMAFFCATPEQKCWNINCFITMILLWLHVTCSKAHWIDR